MEEYDRLHSQESLKTLYVHTEDVHNFAAAREVVPLIMTLVKPASVLDVGCGIGTWLKIFEENGVKDFLGVDGSYVKKNLLKIDGSKFIAHDLSTPLNLHRKFDLAISLEVAEHLSESYADTFVESLTRHADVIVFSAAIPDQGGQNHLNEQWLSYWKTKFDRFNFHLYDAIRPKVWNNSNVDVWYRQNMVVFCKEGHALSAALGASSSNYIDIVHPELFKYKSKQAERVVLFEQGRLGMGTAVKSFLKAVINKLR